MPTKNKKDAPKKHAKQEAGTKTIHPLGDRVLVDPLKEGEGEATASGIIIPETASQERPEMGIVRAVGDGKRCDDGTVVPPQVSVGDTVVFTKFGPDEVTIEGNDYLIVSESNILAVIR